MKKFSLLIVVILSFQAAIFAQDMVVSVMKNLRENVTEVDVKHWAGRGMPIISAYGEDSLYNLYYKGKFTGLDIHAVSLVYSNYKEHGSLSQSDINLARLKNLYDYDSTLFYKEEIAWNTIVLDNISDLEEAKSVFHGFLIHTSSGEDVFLDKVMDGSYSLKDYMEYGGAYVSVYSEEKEAYVSLLDLAIINTLERNKSWNEMLIITDVTGSMMPYSAQLLVWLKLNDKLPRVKSFAFFNDGDNKPDEDKVIGNTGGVYFTDYEELNTVLEVAKESSANGGGGDAKENDLEAIIEGINLSPDAKEIVLIADNGAGPKDIELLYQIKKPIKVILCRTHIPIDPDYLNLAKSTGGSVHTIDNDITNLIELNEGEIIELNGERYVIKDGAFQLLSWKL